MFYVFVFLCFVLCYCVCLCLCPFFFLLFVCSLLYIYIYIYILHKPKQKVQTFSNQINFQTKQKQQKISQNTNKVKKSTCNIMIFWPQIILWCHINSNASTLVCIIFTNYNVTIILVIMCYVPISWVITCIFDVCLFFIFICLFFSWKALFLTNKKKYSKFKKHTHIQKKSKKNKNKRVTCIIIISTFNIVQPKSISVATWNCPRVWRIYYSNTHFFF